jgi:hypothetical protein
MIKISSYQKKVLEIQELKRKLSRLENAIADDNAEVLIEVKMRVGLSRDIESSVWTGETTKV